MGSYIRQAIFGVVAGNLISAILVAQSPPDPLGVEPTPERKALGRRLFFDEILSEDGTVSCATCHQPNKGWADGLPKAVGIRGSVGPLHTPSILNAAYSGPQFWNGRTEGLVTQALLPLENRLEMGGPGNEAVAVRRLRADPAYVRDFALAFGQPPSALLMATAIACFETGVVTRNVPVEQRRNGKMVLTDEGEIGYNIFVKANCVRCHVPPFYTDSDFHNNGASFGFGDIGRASVTRQNNDRRKFKVPSLIGVSDTAPYMHDGSMKTLDEVLLHYNTGGIYANQDIAEWKKGKLPNASVDSNTEIQPLGLNVHQLRYLKVFLLEGLKPEKMPR